MLNADVAAMLLLKLSCCDKTLIMFSRLQAVLGTHLFLQYARNDDGATRQQGLQHDLNENDSKAEIIAGIDRGAAGADDS